MISTRRLITKKYYWVLLAITYSLFVFTFGASATQSSLVSLYMAEKMGATQANVLLADSLRLCTTSASLFFTDYFYDKWKLYRFLMICCALWTIPIFLFPFLPSVGWLYVVKVIQGINAPCFPLLLATLLKWTPSNRYGTASAIFNGFYISGSCLGSIAVVSAERMGAWYLSSVFVGIVALIAWIVIAAITQDRDIENSELSNAETAKQNKAVLRMPATWLMVIAFSACNWVDLAVNADLPVYAQVMGFSVNSASSLMIIVSSVTLITSLIAGAVSDSAAGRGKNLLRQRVLVFVIGFIVCITALIAITRVRTYAELIVCSVIAMAGVSWSNGTFWAIPPLFYGDELINSGTSACTAYSNLVNPIATYVVGVLCGGNGLWSVGWLISAAVCAVSMLCGIALAQKNSKKHITS